MNRGRRISLDETRIKRPLRWLWVCKKCAVDCAVLRGSAFGVQRTSSEASPSIEAGACPDTHRLRSEPLHQIHDLAIQGVGNRFQRQEANVDLSPLDFAHVCPVQARVQFRST